jgi:hypothetical protein
MEMPEAVEAADDKSGGAKLAAVEFVAIHMFGPRHGLKLDSVTVILASEPA